MSVVENGRRGCFAVEVERGVRGEARDLGCGRVGCVRVRESMVM